MGPHPCILALFASALLTMAGAARGQEHDPYRQVLRAWAEDPSTQAVLDLVAFERTFAADPRRLQKFERRSLRQLVDRERLGPIAAAVLHQVAFRLHADSGYPDLVVHSMEMSDWALELGLRAEKSIPEVRETAAILNTAMALALRDYRFVDAASRRLHLAVELDPRLAVAYEWGASAEEQQSRLGRARKLLRRLVELEPDNYPARLRLAMVSAKLGDPAALAMLETIVDSQHRSWVWIFAVQELAQAHARSGRQEEAIALLRRGTEEYPEDQGLAIALAFLDREHRRPSRTLLESLAARGTLGSARVAYGGWEPREPFAQVVTATLKEHLPHLSRALLLTEPGSQ